MAYKRISPQPVVEGGTGATTLTAHGVLVGEGTSAINPLAVGTNGQVLLGSSAADPSFVTPTAGTGLSITTNASTLQYALSTPVSVANGGTGDTSLTAHGVLVGEGTSAITALTVGTNGQVLVGASSADPSFITPTAGTGLSITTNSSTLQYALSTPVSVANGGTGATSLTANSLLLGNGTSAISALGAATNGQIPIGSTSNPPVLATITAGTGITVTNGAGSITIAASSSGITWVDQTSSSVTLATLHGYVIDNGASLVTATLPTTAALGDTYLIVGNSSGGWKIAQNSGQTVHLGSSATTTGTGGSLASTNQYDCITVTCIIANTTFACYGVQGNITVV